MTCTKNTQQSTHTQLRQSPCEPVETVASLASPVCLRVCGARAGLEGGSAHGEVGLPRRDAHRSRRTCSGEGPQRRTCPASVAARLGAAASLPAVTSGPGPRTDIFGLLYDPRTLTNALLTSIYVAHCKVVAGLLPGVARLAPPRPDPSPDFSKQANNEATKVRD